MSPWDLVAWVIAISLIIFVSTFTIFTIVVMVFAFVKPKPSKRDGWSPASVSIYSGKEK